jgi:hypothetical protein
MASDLNPYTCCGLPRFVEGRNMNDLRQPARQCCLVCGAVLLYERYFVYAASVDGWREMAQAEKYPHWEEFARLWMT